MLERSYYLVYFVLEVDRALIVAVLDGRRDPGVIRRLLERRRRAKPLGGAENGRVVARVGLAAFDTTFLTFSGNPAFPLADAIRALNPRRNLRSCLSALT